MTASARFGLLMGLTLIPIMTLGPHPYARMLGGGVVALVLVAAGVLTWRRTGLRLASASMVVAAVGMALLTRVLVLWPDPSAAPPAALVTLGSTLLLAAALMLVQRRTAPQRWDEWRRHTGTVTLADMLRFRHIPVLPRERSEPGP